MKKVVLTYLPVLACFMATAGFAFADEKADLLAKQKSAAEAKWKKIAVENPTPLIQTPHFLIFSRLSEPKTRTLAYALDKQYTTALKALKYTGEDRPWQGKLAIFIFTDRSEFVDYMRKVEKKSPGEDEASAFTFGEESLLVVGVPKGDKAEPEAQAKLELANAMLKRKMVSGEPPHWVALGFAKATEYRAANPGSKGKGPWKMPNVSVAELWGENLPPAARQNYAAYIIDYLAYGPLADQFPSFVGAFRPDESGNAGTPDNALKAINLDANALTLYAKAWTKPKAPRSKP